MKPLGWGQPLGLGFSSQDGCKGRSCWPCLLVLSRPLCASTLPAPRSSACRRPPQLAARRPHFCAAAGWEMSNPSTADYSTMQQGQQSHSGTSCSGNRRHQQQLTSPNPATMTAAARWATQNRAGSFFPAVALGVMLTLLFQGMCRWVYKQLVDIGGIWTTRALEFLDGGQASSGAAPGAPSEEAKELWAPGPQDVRLALPAGVTDATSLVDQANQGESVEWVNMCIRKAWRVYLRGLERWITDLIQPVFDGLVQDGAVPRFVQRLRVVELTLDHEAPYFTNMRKRNSRKDSDLTGVVDLRYTGGARMLMMLEIGSGRWRFKVPVLVSDLDLECQMWLKIRLAPVCPWIGTLSLAFVGPPNVKVQLSPYNRVRLMRIPVVQSFLRQLFTVDLPALMVLPKRLEINIPPSVTSIAEAAVGRDVIMRAVASAVLQADAREQALLAALPLGPQTPAGGVSLPEAFKGELDVVLVRARNLPVWGFPGQSNPYCRLMLGEQAVQSRRDDDTSSPGKHRHPTWNQEFQFLVEDPQMQTFELQVLDSPVTGRVAVGSATLPLSCLPLKGGKASLWLPLKPPPPPGVEVIRGGINRVGLQGGEHKGASQQESIAMHSPPSATPAQGAGRNRRSWAELLGLGKDEPGEVLLEMTYKAFEDGEADCGDTEADAYQATLRQLSQAHEEERITDVRSAAAASSRAAVAASAAISAIAVTRAAAARAAAKATRAAQSAATAAAEQAAAVAHVAAGGVRDTLGGHAAEGAHAHHASASADAHTDTSASGANSDNVGSNGSAGPQDEGAQGAGSSAASGAGIPEHGNGRDAKQKGMDVAHWGMHAEQSGADVKLHHLPENRGSSGQGEGHIRRVSAAVEVGNVGEQQTEIAREGRTRHDSSRGDGKVPHGQEGRGNNEGRTLDGIALEQVGASNREKLQRVEGLPEAPSISSSSSSSSSSYSNIRMDVASNADNRDSLSPNSMDSSSSGVPASVDSYSSVSHNVLPSPLSQGHHKSDPHASGVANSDPVGDGQHHGAHSGAAVRPPHQQHLAHSWSTSIRAEPSEGPSNAGSAAGDGPAPRTTFSQTGMNGGGVSQAHSSAAGLVGRNGNGSSNAGVPLVAPSHLAQEEGQRERVLVGAGLGVSQLQQQQQQQALVEGRKVGAGLGSRSCSDEETAVQQHHLHHQQHQQQRQELPSLSPQRHGGQQLLSPSSDLGVSTSGRGDQQKDGESPSQAGHDNMIGNKEQTAQGSANSASGTSSSSSGSQDSGTEPQASNSKGTAGGGGGGQSEPWWSPLFVAVAMLLSKPEEGCVAEGGSSSNGGRDKGTDASTSQQQQQPPHQRQPYQQQPQPQQQQQQPQPQPQPQPQQQQEQQQGKPWWESLPLAWSGKPDPSSSTSSSSSGSDSTQQQQQQQQQQLEEKGGSTQAESSTTDAKAAQGHQSGGKAWWQFWVREDGPPESQAGDNSKAQGGQGTLSQSQEGKVAGADAPPQQTAEASRGAKGEPKKPWWMFWVGDEQGGGDTQQEASSAATSSSPSSAAAAEGGRKEGQERGSSSKKPWWQFWSWVDESEDENGRKQAGELGDGQEGPEHTRPVDAIIIPPDLPIEDIAEEVARLKQETWRLKEGHVETLWARTVERNDRKWVILAVFLLTVSVGLLATVAYRLDKLSREGGLPGPEAALPLLFLQLCFDIATLFKQ